MILFSLLNLTFSLFNEQYLKFFSLNFEVHFNRNWYKNSGIIRKVRFSRFISIEFKMKSKKFSKGYHKVIIILKNSLRKQDEFDQT